VRRRFAAATALGALLWIPAGTYLVAAHDAFVAGWGGARPVPGVFEIAGMGAELALRVFTGPASSLELVPYALATAAMALAATLGALQALGLRSAPAAGIDLIAASALVPPGLVLAVAFVGPSFWWPRYLVPFLPFLGLLIGAGFTDLLRLHRGAAAVCATLYLAAVGSGLWYYYAEPNRRDWRGALAYVEENRQPSEPVWILGVTPHGRQPRALAEYYGGAMGAVAVPPAEFDVSASGLATDVSLWTVGRDRPPERRVPSGYRIAERVEFWGEITIRRLDPLP
jgi:hypothetical protein